MQSNGFGKNLSFSSGMYRMVYAWFLVWTVPDVADGVSLTKVTDLQNQVFRLLPMDDVIFQHNLMFTSGARSHRECAALCTRHPNCLTFTVNRGSQTVLCYGHSSVMLSSSVVTSFPGAGTFGVISPPTSCRTPFKQAALSGNWTVIQRRCDGSLDFYRNWTEYQVGFGNPDCEFWLGLEKLYSLTSQRPYQLRFDLEQWNGTTGYAVYSNFSVGPASDGYRIDLTVPMIEGNISNQLALTRGMRFTTPDVDNDAHNLNCAVHRQSPWWHRDCTNVNPLGPYKPNAACSDYNCPFWVNFPQAAPGVARTALRRVQMMIRPSG